MMASVHRQSGQQQGELYVRGMCHRQALGVKKGAEAQSAAGHGSSRRMEAQRQAGFCACHAFQAGRIGGVSAHLAILPLPASAFK